MDEFSCWRCKSSLLQHEGWKCPEEARRAAVVWLRNEVVNAAMAYWSEELLSTPWCGHSAIAISERQQTLYTVCKALYRFEHGMSAIAPEDGRCYARRRQNGRIVRCCKKDGHSDTHELAP